MADSEAFGRPRSFAANATEVADRRAEADRLVGEEVRHVRYFTIDYLDMGAPGRPPGLRTARPSEPPTDVWDFGEIHSVDFGVEIETATSRIFSVTWDIPREREEGIGLREARLVGSSLRVDADAEVWDVTSSSTWAPLVGRSVDAVDLDYRPWSEDGDWWCPVITLSSEGHGVVLALGEVGPDRHLAPSADNVLVLAYPASTPFPAAELRLL